MINKAKMFGLLAVFYLLGFIPAEACSVAFYTGTNALNKEVHLTGRTADLAAEYFTVENKITIYPRSREQHGYTAEIPSDPDMWKTWTAKYGSIIIDDFADGFNEKGLCVHPLFLDGSAFPEKDGSTPCVSTLKVTLYLLQNAADVSECLKLIEGITIVPELYKGKPLPMHWAIRDAANNCAIIEFVNKGSKKHPESKKMVYQGSEYDVLTNEPYLEKQLKYYKKYSSGKRGLPGDFNSLARFVRLKMFKKNLPAETGEWENVVNIFSLMSTVHCIPGAIDYSGNETEDEWPTIWTVVTDLDNWKYYIKMTASPNTIWIDFNKFDFGTLTKTGTLGLDDASLVGEVNDKIQWE